MSFATQSRYVIRHLTATPWFVVGAILTVSIATTIAATVFAIVDGVLFKPLPYDDPARVFAVATRQSDRPLPSDLIPRETVEGWRTVSKDVKLAAYVADFGIGPPATAGEVWETTWAAQVEPGFFDVLGQRPSLGGFQPDHFSREYSRTLVLSQHPAIISHRVWTELFGRDSNVIGASLQVSQGTLQIVGVLPPDFVFPLKFGRTLPDVLLPLPAIAAGSPKSSQSVRVLCRLDRATSPAGAEDLLSASVASQNVVSRPDTRVVLQPLTAVLGANQRPLFVWLLGAACLTIVFAGVNVAALFGVRVRSRAREVALRRALGSGETALLSTFAAEAAVIGFVAASLGVCLSVVVIQEIRQLLPSSWVLIKPPALDLRTVSFGFVSAVATVLLAVLVSSSFIISRLRLDLLRASSDVGQVGRYRPGILTLQAWLGLLLVMIGHVTLMHFWRLWHADVGFEPRQLAIVDIRPASVVGREDIAGLFERALEFVRTQPGVRSATAIDGPFLRSASAGSAFELPSEQAKVPVEDVRISTGYFAAAGTAVVRGREPTDAELRLGDPVIVVSASLAAALWPDNTALGRTLKGPSGNAVIVGIAEDVRLTRLEDETTRQIYTSSVGRPPSQTRALLLRTDLDPAGLSGSVKDALRKEFPTLFVTRADSAATALRATARARSLEAILFATFGTAAIVLFAASTFTLLAASVSTRRRELVIRMALGATPARVRVMMAFSALKLVLLGLAAGSLSAWWLRAGVTSILPAGVEIGVASWIASCVALLFVATLAVSVPAWQAGRSNPADALKEV